MNYKKESQYVLTIGCS